MVRLGHRFNHLASHLARRAIDNDDQIFLTHIDSPFSTRCALTTTIKACLSYWKLCLDAATNISTDIGIALLQFSPAVLAMNLDP